MVESCDLALQTAERFKEGLTSAMNETKAWYEDDAVIERELRSSFLERTSCVEIPGYASLEEIGRGGQAIVYRARQVSTGRIVAVKLFHDIPGRAAPHLRRFERETELVSSLRHPAIVTLHDGGVSKEGRPFLVMELVRGVPIDQAATITALRVSKGFDRSVVDPVVALMVKAIHAVAHAHRFGIIHRDLKPANILVDDEGCPRVLDFGLARVSPEIVGGSSSYSLEGGFSGTLAWTSPEQARGERADVRSDVYALGLVLFLLLAGRRAYELPEDLRSALDRAADPPRVRLADLCPGIDADLDAVVAKCLAREPERRYRSADDLARDLERYLAQEPIEARRDSAWYLVRRGLARKKKALIAAGAAVFSLAVALVVSLGALGEAKTASEARAEEARRLKTTLDWLVMLIGSVDPEKDGEDARLADLLDRRAADLDEAFGDDRNSRILLHGALGDVYEKLGKLESAEREYTRLSADLETSPKGPVRERLRARSALLRVRFERTRTIDLSRDLEVVIRGLSAEFGEFAAETIDARVTLAANLRARRDLVRARAIWTEILERGGAALSPVRRIDVREYLVAVESMEGRPELAEKLQRAVVADRERLQGPEHSATLVSRSDLAYYLADLDRLNEAEDLLRRTESVALARFGPSHPKTLSLSEQLAKLVQDRGRPAEAVPLFEAILDRRRTRLGQDHPNTLGTMGNLAVARGLAGDLDGAIAIQSDLVDVLRKTPDPDPFDFANGLANLATMLTRKNRAADALPLYSECVAAAEKSLGRDHWQTATFRMLQANALTRLSRFSESETLLLSAHECLLRTLGESHPNTKKARSLLFELYTAWRKPDTAARWSDGSR